MLFWPNVTLNLDFSQMTFIMNYLVHIVHGLALTTRLYTIEPKLSGFKNETIVNVLIFLKEKSIS